MVARTLKKKMPLTVKVLIAIVLFYLSGWGIICLIKSSLHGVETAKERHLEDFRKTRTPVAEVYVISLHETKFDVFTQRNVDIAPEDDDDDDDDIDVNVDVDPNAIQNKNPPDRKKKLSTSSIEWFKAYDGMDQEVLDDFSRITGLYKLNATDFLADNKKDQYASPHAVGCYLSHWRLLEKAKKLWINRKIKRKERLREGIRKEETPRHRPDMLFVFEDDAKCVSNVIDRTWNTIRQLPKDWDILYLGGKPVSYHVMGKTLHEVSSGKADESDTTTRPSDEQMLEDMCRGKYETSPTGPFAPGTDASDSLAKATAATADVDPPYWQTKYILNTNAYVINPKRIKRVLRVLSAPTYEYKPVDVWLAQEFWRDFMNPFNYNASSEKGTDAPLKAYLTPKMFCDQGAKRTIINPDKPPMWEGYYWLPYRTFTGWPNGSAFVWSTIADRTVCSKFLNATK